MPGASTRLLQRAACGALVATLAGAGPPAFAQPPHGAAHGAPGASDSVPARHGWGAMAIGMATHAAPGALGRHATEGYLTQPMAMGNVQLAGGRLQALGTLNLEGRTLRRGELNTGAYGEGYVDRRHPHTYLHEAMLGAAVARGDGALSLFAGKGVVPFGTDDPMVRPFVKYPVNHHLAQVMERVQVVAAVRLRGVVLEGARFNGDEPEGPSDWPNAGRAFDSWSARLSVAPRRGLELSASTARVHSPEFATGEGLDQAKSSVAARWSRPGARVPYALAEWARTHEASGGLPGFTYRSWLAEGAFAVRRMQLAVRLERTERPEEDRLANPYRSVRPLLDFHVLGRTRWDIATVHAAAPASRWLAVRLAPFAEVAWLAPTALARPAAIEPHTFYDTTRLWLASAGLRVHLGTMRPRWGRYGAAILPRTP